MLELGQKRRQAVSSNALRQRVCSPSPHEPMNTTNGWSAAPKSSISARAEAAWAGAPALVAERLCKAFGDAPRALNGLNLFVSQGEFFGLLGPHGAGKTTAIRILATLLRLDAGRATVLGYDVGASARDVRMRIGYLGQQPGIDQGVSGRDNVLLMARLHGLRRRDAEHCTDEILSALDLTAVARRQAGTYSYQERKLVALAGAVVHRPRLLLLDDPTYGLQPRDRLVVWRYLRTVHREHAVTLFLATQLLEEAEGLCDRVAIIDNGRVIASGTPTELKAQVAGAMVTLRLSDGTRIAEAATLLDRVVGVVAVRPQQDWIDLEVTGGTAVPSLMRLLEEHEIPVRDITLSRSSLDEVFFRHTGRKIHDDHELPATGTKVTGRR